MKNKQIFHLDQTYKSLLRKICTQEINAFPKTPLEWEDLYWEFLYFFCNEKEFDPNKNITFATFLGIECKNFARNKLKRYLSRKHKVLNGYIPPEQTKEYSFELKLESEEAQKLREKDYLNSLEGLDSLIINEHLIDGTSLLSISKKENIGYKKLIHRTKILKSKIRNFVNN